MSLLSNTHDKKGHVDVLLMLLDLKNHFLDEVVPQLGVGLHFTKGLQTHFSSVVAYRKCAPHSVDGTGCQPVGHFPWQGGWPIAQKKLASFIESVLFKNAFEKEVKQNCVNKQAASEILAMQTFQDVFNPHQGSCGAAAAQG